MKRFCSLLSMNILMATKPTAIKRSAIGTPIVSHFGRPALYRRCSGAAADTMLTGPITGFGTGRDPTGPLGAPGTGRVGRGALGLRPPGLTIRGGTGCDGDGGVSSSGNA